MEQGVNAMTKLFEKDFQPFVSRRSFLEGALLAGAGLMAGPSLLARGALAAQPSALAMSGCHWGAFRARVENGRFVEAVPFEKDLFPSPQLPGVLDAVYSPTRIKYPMVRAGYLKDGPKSDTSKRGADEFVRVSWEQALDLVAKELQRVSKEHGPTGIYAGSYGWKSVGKLHNCQNLMRRMLNLQGSYCSSAGDYSTGASQVIMPHVVGRLEVYEQQTAWPVVVEHSKLVVIWGADPVTTNQIGWIVPDHGGYEGLKALKEKGTKVICIDPVRTATSEYLNAEWIAPKPQTDVAIMLGIAHTLVTEKLHDQKFLDDYTVGFDKFLPYLMGETDKTPKTAEWAAGISGLDADLIKRLARDFAKNRTMLMSGWSMQRMHHGEQAHWMLVTLASMLGQIGLPGGGFGLSYHYANGGAPSADSPVLPGITDGSKAGGAAWLATGGAVVIPVARVADMLLNPGKTIDFNGSKVTYPDVKLCYWVGGNPFAHHQDRNRLVKAWQKLETVVVHDFQWTATCRHADIVLPATTTFERDDIEQVGDYAMKAIIGLHKVIEPVFEARDDYEIFREIAKRLGKEKEFTEGKSQLEWIKSFYDATLQQAKAKNQKMPPFEDFWKGDSVVEFDIPKDAKEFVRYKSFRDEPLLEPLGTPSGKIEIYSKNIEKMGYDDCGPHPRWMEPIEWMGGPTKDKYPLHVTTSHPNLRLHSQLAGTVLRDKYAVAGREPCLVNTKDAEARGIKTGDVVRVFNDRGQILAGAVVTDKVRPGVIRVNEGGWYDPMEPGKPGTLCKYGDVNTLTVDIPTSKLAQGNCGHTAVAQIEKYAAAAPAVTVFDAPKNA